MKKYRIIKIITSIDPSAYRHTENSAQALPLKKGEELFNRLVFNGLRLIKLFHVFIFIVFYWSSR